jgi:hypothetical protein
MASQIVEKIKHNLHLVNVYTKVDIDPEIASELLEMNTYRNRNLSDPVVKRYAQLMVSGEWQYNGDVIRIAQTGVLIDGQHRLAAVIKSGTSQQFNIQTGLPESVFDLIDLGKNRTAGDILTIHGMDYGGKISSAVRIIIEYYKMKINKTGKLENVGASRRERAERITHHQILDWIIKHEAEETLQNYATIAGRFYGRFKVVGAPTYLAFLYIFGNKDRDGAMLFFDMLSSGEDISSTKWSMIYLLRQRLITSMTVRKTSENITRVAQDRWALIVKAWNLFREGKEARSLTYNPEKEPFPEAI